MPHFAVLAPTDMVLHSMVHLFHNDDFSHSLRDLSDLDLLLRHFGRGPAFWTDLATRAHELDLARPLFYGLRFTNLLLATPVPRDTLEAVNADGPGGQMTRLMDALWSRALRPQHASAADPFSSAATFALYVRAHWLRMPPALLVRHLTVKALRLHEEPAPATP
jgi:hypothetical protein